MPGRRKVVPRRAARAEGKTRKPKGDPPPDPRRALVEGLRGGDQVVIFADCPPGWNASADGPPPDVTIPAVTSRHNRDRRVAIAAALQERIEHVRDAGRDAHRAGGPTYRIGGPVDSANGFLLLAGAALLDAAADLLELDSWEATGTNQLTYVGELVSAAVRRRWLWDALASTDFHLGAAAQMLRIARGPPAIARMIKDLGLAERVEHARADIAAGRAPRRRPDLPLAAGGRPRRPG
jgi:hypothetical protein